MTISRLRLAFWITALVWLVGFGEAAQAASLPAEALRIARRLAIQDNGRLKPFDSFARETLVRIAGSPTWEHEDPVETVLAIIASPEHWQAEALISVPFVPLREPLGLERRASRISYNDLVASRKLMRMLPPIVQKQRREEKLSIQEQETMDAFERFVSFSGLIEQRLHVVPPPSLAGGSWVPILASAGYPDDQQAVLRNAWSTFISAIRQGQAQVITAAARQLRETLQAAHPGAYPSPWRMELEVFYNRAGPFRTARLAYLLAALAFLLSLTIKAQWPPSIGLAALVAGFLLHGAGIAMRVVLGGRPPVSNFYETTLWLPFVAVAISLAFERIYRVRFFGLAAALLASITLVLADHLPLDSSSSPVVAVLRSNLWLTVHVLTIVASYGALALATVLAHLYGWLYVARRSTHPTLSSLDIFLYRALQVGVVLLAAGIMLGAVWANASWGRYWGWDPKETWALITLLWFLAVLHGRFAGWIKGVGVALATIGGFFLLLMTYYGVSFYLVGLHSYAGGHAKPLPPLLIAYLVAEVAFLALVGLVALRRQRLA